MSLKLRFPKPIRFPSWSRIDTNKISQTFYHPFEDGVKSTISESGAQANHVEMAGLRCSSIISYKVDDKKNLTLHRFTIFPSLRINPNDTRGSLPHVFKGVDFTINGKKEEVESIFFNGMLSFKSVADCAKINRTMYVSPSKRALVEELEFNCDEACKLLLKRANTVKKIRPCFTATGEPYFLNTKTYINKKIVSGNGVSIPKGKTVVTIVYSAGNVSLADAKKGKEGRLRYLHESAERLNIITPNEDINRAIRFAKIRAGESIFKTKNGLMHGPGGGNFYAALWTNDQCEYANPFFAYLGYDTAMKQSLNCYHLYSKLAKKDKAIYTSIVAEGDDYWNGAGDRGDSSMYVYGFARYLLTTGDKSNAKKYLQSLEDACEYEMSKMNANGVIESDSDELENRFESGKANLSTAVISYDAFISMSYLEKELGNNEKSEMYRDFAEKIKDGIHTYFEADVEGFATYRYCAEESHLRSWICLPLTVGITDRLDGTISALQSDKLKKPCGLLTRSGEKTFWDRSLLYALRGLFYVGKADEALEMLTEYTATRLYGSHVPYPIEAFPEGNAAHLSAESALYVRIFTEGTLGFRPLGFSSFEIKPNLPTSWNDFTVENFMVAGKKLSISLKKNDDNTVTISIPELKLNSSCAENTPFTVNM